MRIIIFLFLVANFCNAQSANLKLQNYNEIKNVFKIEIEAFESLEFIINGVAFKVSDDLDINIPLNKMGFDSIKYSYKIHDKEYKSFALAKFKTDQQYYLSPCTCCGIFMIAPKNPERGIVRFKNRSKSKLLALTGDFEHEVIYPKSTSKYFFSSISMNCGFTPNQIGLFTSDFIESKEGIFEIDREIFSFDFLFVNGEKLSIIYNGNQSKVVFDGYLNSNESQKYFKKYEE